ncbi:MAG: methyltransferase, FkbM family [Phycisphaerales bacterium]|nr:methyltransferase, FkbM family [Phycisphaerales bacterium]
MVQKLARLAAMSVGRALGRLSRFRLARIAFLYAARGYAPAVLCANGPIKYLVGSGDYVGENVMESGGFDDEVISRIFGHLAAAGFTDFAGKTFVDIGANIGTTCIPQVHGGRFARGFAIEPGPLNVDLLRANIVLNGLNDRFTVIHAGVTDQTRPLTFELSDDNSGDHRVRESGVRVPGRTQVEVPGVTLDSLVAGGVLKPDEVGLYWIDTQGHEASVLAGATVFRNTPVPVVIEYWPRELLAIGTRDALHARLKELFTHFVDLRLPDTIVRPVADVDRLDPDVLTDLLMLSR